MGGAVTKDQGYSLLELMFVVLIITILTTFVYPNYLNHLNKARRNEAKAALFDLASRLEAYYAEHNSYEKASLGTGGKTSLGINDRTVNGWYRLKIIKADKESYRLEARPLKAQARSDRQCQTLTLNNLGQQGIAAGPAGQPRGRLADCW